MDKKYYVQVIAHNYLKNVVADSISIKVHDKFLYGLNTEEFAEGYNSLLSLVRQLYKDIAVNPSDFGTILKEAEDIDARNTEYTNSNASFLRVPNLLYMLGISSTLEPNGALSVDCGILLANAKALKITGLPLLLAKLRDYGFDISDFGKAPKTGETLLVAYMDNRFFTTALKSMADALSELTKGDLRNPKNDYFYMMHPTLIDNEVVKEPKLTISTIYNALDPVQRGFAANLHDYVTNTTKHSIRKGQLMRNEWTSTYTGKKSKKVLMSLQVKQGNLSVKLNLQNINQYISLIADMPERFQNVITNGGWECGQCNPRCSGGFMFEVDSKAFNKCHCGSFVFGDLFAEDIDYFERLIAKELAADAG